MNKLLRLIQWICDSLPLYNARHVGNQWLDGYNKGSRSVGITRDNRGRFCRMT